MEFAINPPQICALIVATIGSITDVRTTKIPNKLTFPAALLGIVVQSAYFASKSQTSPLTGAVAGAINAILGWITAVAIMMITKLFLKHFGHGDTKLLAAIGSFIGPGPVAIAYMYFCFVFGVYAFIRLMIALPWRQLTLAYMSHSTQGLDLEKINKIRKQALPVAPFIAIGTACAMLLEKPTMLFLGFK